MYQLQEDRFYYLTLYNENYPMPAMPQELNPEGVLERHLPLPGGGEGKAVVQLFGSGPILNEAVRAQKILADQYRRGCRCVECDQL